MADQRLNGFLRQAIWEIHLRRCAYCREPLRYKDMEVDHIIAEYNVKDAEILDKVLREHGLDNKFDLQSLDNLVPACHDCNKNKLDRPLAVGAASIFIAKAKALRESIEAKAAWLNRQTQIDKGRAIVSAAYESGQLTDADILGMMSKPAELTRKFPLSQFILQLGNDPIGEISMEHADAYLDLPIELNDGEGLRLTKWSDDGSDPFESTDVRFVKTLREYSAAVDDDYYPLTNADMKNAAWLFDTPLAIFRYLSNASIPSTSYISNPRVGLADLSLLPASLFTLIYTPEDEEVEILRQAKTIQDLVDLGRIRVTKSGTHFLSLEGTETTDGRHDGNFVYVSEILRTDIDGDGIEDILLYVGGGPIDGTHRESNVIACTRLSPDSLLTMLPTA